MIYLFISCRFPDREKGDFRPKGNSAIESMDLTGGVDSNRVETYQLQKRSMFIR